MPELKTFRACLQLYQRYSMLPPGWSIFIFFMAALEWVSRLTPPVLLLSWLSQVRGQSRPLPSSSRAFSMAQFWQIEKAHRASQARLRLALNAAHMLAWELDLTTGGMAQFGETETIWGTNITSADAAIPLIHPVDRRYLQATLRNAITTNGNFVVQYRILRPDTGEVRWLEDHARVIPNPDGSAGRIRGVTLDITAEHQLQQLVQEKETLLREVHHRVKNNLQAISNLLSLQAAYLSDEKMRYIFRETQDRVKSMALIHEKLYEGDDLAHPDFRGYVRSLAHHLIKTYSADPDRITLGISVEEVNLDLDIAVALGIIINELVSNSVKHAFSGLAEGQPQKIDIELGRGPDDGFHLNVGDNGTGLPEEQDLTNPSLGLQLVNLLTAHMKGTLELDRSHGTTFKINFPLPDRER